MLTLKSFDGKVNYSSEHGVMWGQLCPKGRFAPFLVLARWENLFWLFGLRSYLTNVSESVSDC